MLSHGRPLKTKDSMNVPDTLKVNINRSTVYLKMYGISKPEEEFLKGFQRTIEDQIAAISLKNRAEHIYKSIIPTVADFEFIRENSEQIFLYYRLPTFLMNYIEFIDQLKATFNSYLTPIQMNSVKDADYVISKTINRSGTTAKKSFRITNKFRRSFYANPAVFSTMVAESSGDLIDTTGIKEKDISKSPICEENEEQSSIKSPENAKMSQYQLEKIDEESFTFDEFLRFYDEIYDSDDY